ncbi:MAG: ATP-binding protein [Candidatus Dojkabacteria bacterium]|nr:MAG: ATP-binding protein [Candidatus Dojkabacteria bacterium]
MNELTATNIGYLISLATSVVLGMYLLIVGRNNISKLFALIIYTVSFWILANLMSEILRDEQQVLFWTRAAMIGPILLMPLMYEFSKAFPDGEKKFKWTQVGKSLLFSIPLLVLVPTSYNVSSVELKPEGGANFEPGFLYAIFLVYSVIFVGLTIRNLWKKYETLHGLDRVKVLYIFVGFTLSFSLGLIFSVVLPILGIPGAAVFGPISSVIFFIIVAYVLIRYRLFGIRFVLTGLLYIFLISVFVLVSFYAAFFIQSYIWGSVYDPRAIISGFFIAVLFYFTFQALESYFRKIAFDLLGGRKRLDDARNKYQKSVSTSLSLEDIEKQLGAMLSEIYDAKFMLWADPSQELFLSNFEKSVDVQSLRSGFANLKEAVIIDEINALDYLSTEGKDTLEYAMRLHGINLAIPFQYGEGTFGWLFISESSNGSAYSIQDLEYLTSIVEMTSVAISRSILYSEVQKFNLTLQKKIDQATSELNERYDELREIRAKERDMMDIMGHELRTPLSIIKISLGALDMQAEKHPDKFNAETYLHHQERLRDAIHREIKLLETMLTSTKIDAARIELVKEKVNLVTTINDAILSQKEKADDKKLELKVEGLPAELPVFGDKVRLGEVMDNLVSNAVKYTEQGSVIVNVDVNDPKMVAVSITDTGPGIPKEALPRLGEKFFRVGQYLDRQAGNGTPKSPEIVRPGGTGLGLYVTFGLVKLMGGKLSVTSEVGKGSVFTFTIPKFTGQKEDVGYGDEKDLFSRLGLMRNADGEVVERSKAEEGTTVVEEIGATKVDSGEVVAEAVDPAATLEGSVAVIDPVNAVTPTTPASVAPVDTAPVADNAVSERVAAPNAEVQPPIADAIAQAAAANQQAVGQETAEVEEEPAADESLLDKES